MKSISIYDNVESRLTKMKNRGFDYEGKIFERSMSPILFNDEKRRDILLEFEKVFFHMIEKTKLIKTSKNYTVDKDEKHLN